MERELTNNLITCFDAFVAVTGRKHSGVAQVAANDWRFYDRLKQPGVTFTARKYDEIVAWFDANWPEGAERPEAVVREHKAAAE